MSRQFDDAQYIRANYSDYEELTPEQEADLEKSVLDKYDTSFKSLDEYEQRDVEWLVDDYIPKNTITIIGGDGGSGKTALWNSLVADVASGRVTIFEQYLAGALKKDEGCKVVFLSSEDTVEEVLKTRIVEYQPKQANIIPIPFSDPRFKEMKFGSEYLEALIRNLRPKLIVFDPLQSFIGEDVIMGARNQMREKINALAVLCDKYKVTAIVIAHANKRKGAWGRDRLADSADIWDIARSVILCGRTSDGLFYASQEKCNYGPRQKTLLFTFDGKITFKSFTDKHDYDFIMSEPSNTKPAPALEEAKDMILKTVMDNEGKMLIRDLDDLANALSIKPSTLSRAKTTLRNEGKIKTSNTGYGKDKRFYIQVSDHLFLE